MLPATAGGSDARSRNPKIIRLCRIAVPDAQSAAADGRAQRRQPFVLEMCVMATWATVRRIALTLPESAEKTGSSGTATWTVRSKSFAWERPLRRSDFEALGEAAPAGAILGVRTADLEMKEALLLSDPAVFFTTPHFDGYAAVLIVLAKITTATLRDVLIESWLARAPTRVANAFLAARKPKQRHRSSRTEA